MPLIMPRCAEGGDASFRGTDADMGDLASSVVPSGLCSERGDLAPCGSTGNGARPAFEAAAAMSFMECPVGERTNSDTAFGDPAPPRTLLSVLDVCDLKLFCLWKPVVPVSPMLEPACVLARTSRTNLVNI